MLEVDMSDGASPIDQFRDFLETKGMRLTPEREAVVRAVFFQPQGDLTRTPGSRSWGLDRMCRKPAAAPSIVRWLFSKKRACIRKVDRPGDREEYEHD